MKEMQEAQIQYLGQEDPLEEEMATHSRILARNIPWAEDSGALQSMGSQRVGHDWTRTWFMLMAIINQSLIICSPNFY